MRFRLALAAATCLALPLAAHAQPVTGPYVDLLGGTSILNPVGVNEKVNYQGQEYDGFDGKMLFENSYAGAADVGYGFGNGFRVEIGGDYFHNTAKKLNLPDYGYNSYAAEPRIYGSVNTYGPMLNVLYDFNVGLPVYPYIGAGGGYLWVQDKLTGPNYYYNGSVYEPYQTSGSVGSFAYDIIAGLSFPIAPIPGLSVIGEYRFTQLVQERKYGDSVTGGIPSGNPDGGTIKFGQASSHTFLIGLRYQIFNPPPPAPAPAPAPVIAPAPPVAKTYLVFFDWDKYSLTPRALNIISEAASDSKTTSTTEIDVSGYTDTSGTPVYNQGLSERRAKAVAAQLVADGVPGSEIETFAFGETHLLVPTGPGVREPQNRRVEIVLK
jgi:outer membrane protein OmpA-like peptidoglycan-associated protein